MEEINFRDKLILCPSCTSENSVEISDTEALCEDCGEDFLIDMGGMSPQDNFVWHPRKKF